MKRYFIVGPTEVGKAWGDTLWQLCSTTSRMSFADIYATDQYEVVDSRGDEKSIKRLAKQYGCDKPTII
jgi:hypothetical protein